MTSRSRPLLLALTAALVLVVALSKETWVAVPIVAVIAVLLLARGHRLGRRPTAAALVFVGSIAFVVFGAVITILSQLARHLGGLVFASGISAIALGLIGLVVTAVYLRRAMRPAPQPGDPPGAPVSSR
jgi:hypothetical protein